MLSLPVSLFPVDLPYVLNYQPPQFCLVERAIAFMHGLAPPPFFLNSPVSRIFSEEDGEPMVERSVCTNGKAKMGGVSETDLP